MTGFARECREGEPMTTPAPIAETGFVVVGLHDWQTLGLPVEPGSAESEASDA